MRPHPRVIGDTATQGASTTLGLTERWRVDLDERAFWQIVFHLPSNPDIFASGEA